MQRGFVAAASAWTKTESITRDWFGLRFTRDPAGIGRNRYRSLKPSQNRTSGPQ